jgi:hypothetical protein
MRTDQAQTSHPLFPRLRVQQPAGEVGEPLVPLLDDAQYQLLMRLSRLRLSLFECSFADAQRLRVHGLIEIDRHTDMLKITDEGRRFLTAGP